MPREFIPPETCPVCGEDVPRGAKACPGCGADERSGWNEDATLYDDLDLPDEAFADAPPPTPRRLLDSHWFWLGVAAVLLAVLIYTLIPR